MVLISKSFNKESRAGHTTVNSLERFTNAWRRLVLNTWLGEAAAVVFSVACLVAITIVLRIYDGKASPQMAWGVTLNAIIAILSTASKAALIFAVAGALGQLKWVWFTENRQLSDLQLFDDASRGPLGSISLLACLHVKTAASIGAIVMVLALTFEPFLQQILKYPIRQSSHPSSAAIASKASIYGVDFTSIAFSSALNSGLWDYGADFQDVLPCASGNCHWPAFRSVGWCSKCADVTQQASISECDVPAFWNRSIDKVGCDISLGDGATAAVVRGGLHNGSTVFTKTDCSTSFGLDDPDCYKVNLQVDTDRVLAEAKGVVWVVHQLFQEGEYGYRDGRYVKYAIRNRTILGIRSPILVLGHAIFDDSVRGHAPRLKSAEKCVLTLCEREYNISVSDGVPNMNIGAINYGYLNVAAVRDSPSQSYASGELFEESCWQSQPGNVTYEIIPYEVDGFVDTPGQGHRRRGASKRFTDILLGEKVPGGAMFWANKSRNAFCPVDYFSEYIAQPLLGTSSRYCVRIDGLPRCLDLNIEVPSLIHANGLKYVVDRVAAALTKLGHQLSNETVSGNVITSEVYVHVEWRWLILPIALEVIGIAFLTTTAIASNVNQTRLWKSSMLPLIFHGIEAPGRERDVAATEVSAMEEIASTMVVRLKRLGGHEQEYLRSDD